VAKDISPISILLAMVSEIVIQIG